jgi:hypothetical protein
MFNHEDGIRLELIASRLRDDDPVLTRALQEGQPRAPREYRRARLHMLAYAVLSASALALAVAFSAWPLGSAAALLAAIVFSLFAAVANPSFLDQPTSRSNAFRMRS